MDAIAAQALKSSPFGAREAVRHVLTPDRAVAGTRTFIVELAARCLDTIREREAARPRLHR